MANVRQAVDGHLTALNLKAEDSARVRAAANTLNMRLRKDFDPQGEVQQGGSLKRGTAIRPLKDVDLLLLLSLVKYPHIQSQNPEEVTKAIQAQLGTLGLTTRVQNRSLGLVFEGISFDLVPCWRDPTHKTVLRLPDIERGSWLSTSPEEHAQLGRKRDKDCAQRLLPLIRGMKAWNVHHGKPLRSFHIEVMMWEVWKDSVPEKGPEGLLVSFFRLAERVKRPTADPAGKGPIVDEGVTPADRAHASSLLSTAASLAATLHSADDPQAVLTQLLGPKPA